MAGVGVMRVSPPRLGIGRRIFRVGSRGLLYVLPLLNVVADRLIGYLGTWGGIHAGHVRSALLMTFVVLWIPFLRANKTNLTSLLFLGYLAALVPFASDLAVTLTQYHKVFLSLILFSVGYASIRKLEHLERLHVGIYAALAFVVLHFVFVQVFQLGPSPYLEGLNVYWGPREGGEVYQAYIITYAVLLYPSTLAIFRPRIPGGGAARLIFLVASLGILVLMFRRSAMLAAGVGGVCYLVLARRTSPFLKLLLGALLVIPIGWSRYGSTVVALFEARGDIVDFVQYTEVGRMAEFSMVGRAWLEGSLAHKAFGSDLFNSWAFFGLERPVHIDYLQVFVGAGVVGLLLYCSVYASIVWLIISRSERVQDALVRRELRATGLAMVSAAMILGLGQQLLVLTPLSLFFAYMGALLGVMSHSEETLAPSKAQPT